MGHISCITMVHHYTFFLSYIHPLNADAYQELGLTLINRNCACIHNDMVLWLDREVSACAIIVDGLALDRMCSSDSNWKQEMRCD